MHKRQDTEFSMDSARYLAARQKIITLRKHVEAELVSAAPNPRVSKTVDGRQALGDRNR